MSVSIPGLIIICGLQGGGKSHLIHYIMHENWKKFDWGIVISNNRFLADNFDYINKCFLYAKYDEFIFANLKSIHELVEKVRNPVDLSFLTIVCLANSGAQNSSVS
jgi:predicted alpha/beta-fold hydrolase